MHRKIFIALALLLSIESGGESNAQESLEGLYIESSQLNNTRPSTLIEISQCNPKDCDISYSNNQYHACGFSGKLIFENHSHGVYNNEKCHIEFSFSKPRVISFSLNKEMDELCYRTFHDKGECGESGGIDSGNFVRKSARIRPSFNCEKAVTLREKTICHIPSLADFDRDISIFYTDLTTKMGVSTGSTCQKDWLTLLDHTCDKKEVVADCLHDGMTQRRYLLNRANDCFEQRRSIETLPTSDEIDLSYYKGEKLSGSAAEAMLSKVISSSLRQRIPRELWDTLKASSQDQVPLKVERRGPFVIFYREYRYAYAVMIGDNGEVWSIGHDLDDDDTTSEVILGPQKDHLVVPHTVLGMFTEYFQETSLDRYVILPYYPDWRAGQQKSVDATILQNSFFTLDGICSRSLKKLCKEPFLYAYRYTPSTSLPGDRNSEQANTTLQNSDKSLVKEQTNTNYNWRSSLRKWWLSFKNIFSLLDLSFMMGIVIWLVTMVVWFLANAKWRIWYIQRHSPATKSTVLKIYWCEVAILFTTLALALTVLRRADLFFNRYLPLVDYWIQPVIYPCFAVLLYKRYLSLPYKQSTILAVVTSLSFFLAMLIGFFIFLGLNVRIH